MWSRARWGALCGCLAVSGCGAKASSDVQTGAEAGAGEGAGTDRAPPGDALLNEAPDGSEPTGGADDGLGDLTDQPDGDEPEEESMLNSTAAALRTQSKLR